MSTLKERLDRMRDGFRKQGAPESLAIMQKAHNELVNSGITERMIEVGEQFPSFSLPDTDGSIVHSNELLASGPLAVVFYRGVW